MPFRTVTFKERCKLLSPLCQEIPPLFSVPPASGATPVVATLNEDDVQREKPFPPRALLLDRRAVRKTSPLFRESRSPRFRPFMRWMVFKLSAHPESGHCGSLALPDLSIQRLPSPVITLSIGQATHDLTSRMDPPSPPSQQERRFLPDPPFPVLWSRTRIRWGYLYASFQPLLRLFLLPDFCRKILQALRSPGQLYSHPNTDKTLIVPPPAPRRLIKTGPLSLDLFNKDEAFDWDSLEEFSENLFPELKIGSLLSIYSYLPLRSQVSAHLALHLSPPVAQTSTFVFLWCPSGKLSPLFPRTHPPTCE